MSKLLINERPLQVLPSLAVAIGLNEAIVLQQLHYWLKEAGKVRDGKLWVYNTYEDWNRQFPFWSNRTVQRVIGNLEKRGLVLSTDKYNKIPSDRTKWYTIDYDELDALEGVTRQIDEATLRQSDEVVNHRIPIEEERPSLFVLYEQNIGPLTPIIRDKLGDALDDYGEEWCWQAIQVAVENNKRSMAYILGVLRRSREESRPPKAGLEKSKPFPFGDPLDNNEDLNQQLAEIAAQEATNGRQ
jgi:DnaD/phage-associated family protein